MSKKNQLDNQFESCSSSFFYFCNFIKQQELQEFKHINFDLILDILIKTTNRDCIIYSTRSEGYTTSNLFYLSYCAFFAKKDSTFLVCCSKEQEYKKYILDTLVSFNKLFDSKVSEIKVTADIVVQNFTNLTKSKIIVRKNLNISLLKSQIMPFELFIYDVITNIELLEKWLELRTILIANTEKELIYSIINFNEETKNIISKTHNIINQ